MLVISDLICYKLEIFVHYFETIHPRLHTNEMLELLMKMGNLYQIKVYLEYRNGTLIFYSIV